jgi:hypothetical protein
MKQAASHAAANGRAVDGMRDGLHVEAEVHRVFFPGSRPGIADATPGILDACDYWEAAG